MTARRPLAATALSVMVSAVACSRADPSPTRATPEPTRSAAPSSAPSQTGPLVLARGLRIVKAGGGAADDVVRVEKEKAASDGRDLVVYVGAKWCEPCQRFHAAAQAGELDADFPSLTILEFDLDEDRDRLVAAGYVSQLIPLFVLPGDDGRATARRFEGSVKGDRAVSNIAPRLRSLLAR